MLTSELRYDRVITVGPFALTETDWASCERAFEEIERQGDDEAGRGRGRRERSADHAVAGPPLRRPVRDARRPGAGRRRPDRPAAGDPRPVRRAAPRALHGRRRDRSGRAVRSALGGGPARARAARPARRRRCGRRTIRRPPRPGRSRSPWPTGRSAVTTTATMDPHPRGRCWFAIPTGRPGSPTAGSPQPATTARCWPAPARDTRMLDAAMAA